MLGTAFRNGVASARAAGWRAYALALLSYVPIGATVAVPNPLVLFAGLFLHVVVLLALIRVLGASRPEPVPAPPQVDDAGRRVLPPVRRGPPLTHEDRRAVTALRNAVRLWRPALSLAGLVLLAQLGALLTVVALSGGKVAEYASGVQLAAILPVSGLFMTFVVLAPQRIALEGETRVLVAAAHSVRIARGVYGPLLLLTVAEPLVGTLGLLGIPEKNPPPGRVLVVGGVTMLVVTFVQVVVTAIQNDVYVNGPRLELPVDPG